jgi:hypothetical protein
MRGREAPLHQALALTLLPDHLTDMLQQRVRADKVAQADVWKRRRDQIGELAARLRDTVKPRSSNVVCFRR